MTTITLTEVVSQHAAWADNLVGDAGKTFKRYLTGTAEYTITSNVLHSLQDKLITLTSAFCCLLHDNPEAAAVIDLEHARATKEIRSFMNAATQRFLGEFYPQPRERVDFGGLDINSHLELSQPEPCPAPLQSSASPLTQGHTPEPQGGYPQSKAAPGSSRDHQAGPASQAG